MRPGLNFVIGTILFLAVVTASPGHAGNKRFSPDLADRLHRISGHIYNDNFDKAELLIDSLGFGRNKGFVIFFLRAILYQSMMMAAESDFLEDEYFDLLDSLENGAEEMLSAGADSALAYWYLGHAHAFRSLYRGRAGSILKALRSGLAARKAYSRGYKFDSTFHDIALGLGSYRYWKSVKTKAINWTPLFKNEKQNGIDLLRLAADSSEISRDAAASALIWVYINEKRYPEAIRLATAMRDRYPQGLTFLWALGEIYYKLEDCRAAIDTYGVIFDRLKENPGNYYNIIEAAFYLSECYRRMSDQLPKVVESLTILQDYIRNLTIPEKTAKRQKKKLKKILRN
jgi:hypothetical protein